MVACSTQSKNVVFRRVVYLPNSMHGSGSIMPIMGGSISPIIDTENTGFSPIQLFGLTKMGGVATNASPRFLTTTSDNDLPRPEDTLSI